MLGARKHAHVRSIKKKKKIPLVQGLDGWPLLLPGTIIERTKAKINGIGAMDEEIKIQKKI